MDFFKFKTMKRKILIVLLFTFLLVSCSTSFEETYIKQKYDDCKIVRKYKIDNSINSDECFIENAMLIENDEHKLLCQFVKTDGFHKGIYLMTSIDVQNNEIYEVDIIEHYETEDYGGHVSEKWFLDRFAGKLTNEPLKTVIMIDKEPNEVISITGATMTSRAVVRAVNLCMENFKIQN